uniref:Proton-activated chloride channel n=2 Tax=Macrostomum lignano TaxID=282301 RepID=A0A1I8HTS3_9PLAT
QIQLLKGICSSTSKGYYSRTSERPSDHPPHGLSGGVRAADMHRHHWISWATPQHSLQLCSQGTIYRWFQDFSNPGFELGDATRSGRPCSTRTTENIDVISDLVKEDPRQSVRELADCLEIDFKTVHRILTEDLHLRSVCSVWVPYDLTADQRQARVNCAKQIRKVFSSRGLNDILNCLVVEDETWLHLDGKGSKADNRCWLGAGDSKATVTRRSISDKKTMLLVAFTPNKRVSICTTPPNTKVDGQYFIDFVRHTGDLWRTLRSNPCHLDEVLWQMDNARPHTCKAVSDFLAGRRVNLLWQSPYSPDFNLCDRFLFKWLKADFSKRSFANHEEVKQLPRCTGSGSWRKNTCRLRSGVSAAPCTSASQTAVQEKYISKREYYWRVSSTVAMAIVGVAACLFTVQLIQDLLQATRYPVRSVKHRPVDRYDAPGIAVFPNGPRLQSCSYYRLLSAEFWNRKFAQSVTREKLEIEKTGRFLDHATQWNLNRTDCDYRSLTYRDAADNQTDEFAGHDALVFMGPSRVKEKETLFLYFTADTSDDQDFYSLGFLLFHDYWAFSNRSQADRLEFVADIRSHQPMYAASAGLRMWNRLSMTHMELEGGHEPTQVVLDLEYSLVWHWDRHQSDASSRKQFFLFFEWKSGIVAESYIMRTQSVWSFGAALCGVLLTLHKGYSLAAGNIRELRRTRARRTRSRQLKRLWQQHQRDLRLQKGAVNRGGPSSRFGHFQQLLNSSNGPGGIGSCTGG